MDSTSLAESSSEDQFGATALDIQLADIAPTDECYRCGYALRGIANDQPCPECGLLAERSRHPTDALHDTRPGWLRKLSLGTKLLCLAIVLGSTWPMVADALQRAIYRYAYNRQLGTMPWWTEPFGYQIVPFAGIDLTAICALASIWLITARERYEPSDQHDYRRRALLRILAIVLFLSAMLMHLAVWWMTRSLLKGIYHESEAAWLAIWTMFAIAVVPMPLLLFRQFRSLAKRARSAHLMEHCTIVGIGAMCAFAFLIGVAITFAYATQLGLPSNWTTRSQTSLALMVAGTAGALLFVLWSLYLLVRFTISFHFASRKMQKKWDRDDRSLGSFG